METETTRCIQAITPQRPAMPLLRQLTDFTLAPLCSQDHSLSPVSILLPVVGTLQVQIGAEEIEIPCGEILIFNGARPITITNPYESCLVNYLVIEIQASYQQGEGFSRYAFNLGLTQNEMTDLFHSQDLRVSIGKFEMRREATYKLCSQNNRCFCFVIQGSFEIEGRLLHDRDSLAIWDTDQLELESLGGSSILFLLEQLELQY
ncbi:hypothetical protein GCM10027051_22050 [Niabella terrae]